MTLQMLGMFLKKEEKKRKKKSLFVAIPVDECSSL